MSNFSINTRGGHGVRRKFDPLLDKENLGAVSLPLMQSRVEKVFPMMGTERVGAYEKMNLPAVVAPVKPDTSALIDQMRAAPPARLPGAPAPGGVVMPDLEAVTQKLGPMFNDVYGKGANEQPGPMRPGMPTQDMPMDPAWWKMAADVIQGKPGARVPGEMEGAQSGPFPSRVRDRQILPQSGETMGKPIPQGDMKLPDGSSKPVPLADLKFPEESSKPIPLGDMLPKGNINDEGAGKIENLPGMDNTDLGEIVLLPAKNKPGPWRDREIFPGDPNPPFLGNEVLLPAKNKPGPWGDREVFPGDPNPPFLGNEVLLRDEKAGDGTGVEAKAAEAGPQAPLRAAGNAARVLPRVTEADQEKVAGADGQAFSLPNIEFDTGVKAPPAKPELPLMDGDRGRLDGKISALEQQVRDRLIPKVEAREAERKGFVGRMTGHDARPEYAVTGDLDRLNNLKLGGELTQDDLNEIYRTDPALFKDLQGVRNQKQVDDGRRWDLTRAEKEKRADESDQGFFEFNPKVWQGLNSHRVEKMSVEELPAFLQKQDARLKLRRDELDQQKQGLMQDTEALHTTIADMKARNDALLREDGFEPPKDGMVAWHPKMADEAARLEVRVSAMEDRYLQHEEVVQKYNEELALRQVPMQQAQKRLEELRVSEQTRAMDGVRYQGVAGSGLMASELEKVQQGLKDSLTKLHEAYPGGIPQEKIQEIEKQAGEQQQQVVGRLQQRIKAVHDAYASMRTRMKELPNIKLPDGELWEVAKKQVMDQANVSEEEAQMLLEDAKALDWDSYLPGENEAWILGKDERTTRTLPNGALVVHPRLYADPQGYVDAVNASTASPEAKRVALEMQPQLRRQWAGQIADTLMSESDIPGLPNFNKWLGERQGEDQRNGGATGYHKMSTEDLVLRYVDEMKSRPAWEKYVDTFTRRFISAGGNLGASVLGLVAMAQENSPANIIKKKLTGQDDGKVISEAISGVMADWTKSNNNISSSVGLKGGLDTKGMQAAAVFADVLPQVGPMLYGAHALKGVQFGKWMMMGLNGAQSAGQAYASMYTELIEDGMTHERAYAETMPVAVGTGAATMLLGQVMDKLGPKAAENMAGALNSPAVKQSVMEAWKGHFSTLLGNAGGSVGRLTKEMAEETADNLFSEVLKKLSMNPLAKIDEVIVDVIKQSPDILTAVLEMGALSKMAGGGGRGKVPSLPGMGVPNAADFQSRMPRLDVNGMVSRTAPLHPGAAQSLPPLQIAPLPGTAQAALALPPPPQQQPPPGVQEAPPAVDGQPTPPAWATLPEGWVPGVQPSVDAPPAAAATASPVGPAVEGGAPVPPAGSPLPSPAQSPATLGSAGQPPSPQVMGADPASPGGGRPDPAVPGQAKPADAVSTPLVRPDLPAPAPESMPGQPPGTLPPPPVEPGPAARLPASDSSGAPTGRVPGDPRLAPDATLPPPAPDMQAGPLPDSVNTPPVRPPSQGRLPDAPARPQQPPLLRRETPRAGPIDVVGRLPDGRFQVTAGGRDFALPPSQAAQVAGMSLPDFEAKMAQATQSSLAGPRAADGSASSRPPIWQGRARYGHQAQVLSRNPDGTFQVTVDGAERTMTEPNVAFMTGLKKGPLYEMLGKATDGWMRGEGQVPNQELANSPANSRPTDKRKDRFQSKMDDSATAESHLTPGLPSNKAPKNAEEVYALLGPLVKESNAYAKRWGEIQTRLNELSSALKPKNYMQSKPSFQQTASELAEKNRLVNEMYALVKEDNSLRQQQDRLAANARTILAIPEGERGRVQFIGTDLENFNPELTKVWKTAREGALIVEQYIHPSLLTEVSIHTSPHTRSGYNHRHAEGNLDRTAYLTQDAGVITAAHEMIHAIECREIQEWVNGQPVIRQPLFEDARAFLLQRAKGVPAQRLQDLEPSGNFEPHEMVFEDDWAKNGGENYTGRDYPQPMTEIFTMGLQRLHDDAVRFMSEDPEHFAKVLKLRYPNQP